MTSGLSEGYYEADTGKGYRAIVTYVKNTDSNWTICAATNTQKVNASARSSALIVIAVGVVMLLIAAVISVKMALSFTNPVQAVNE